MIILQRDNVVRRVASDEAARKLEEQGIRPNTIRLSIGTEHIDDILQDLEEAFRAVAE